MCENFTKYLALILIFFISSGKLFSQQDEIEAKKNQLTDVKKELTSLESELNNKTKKEKESFSAIENYSKQSFLLNKLIGNYRIEERQKEKQIGLSENNIGQLQNDIKLLEDNYAKYVSAIYKHGQPGDIEMLVNSASVQQALLRFKYLEKFSKQRKKDVTDLKKRREQLIAEKEILKKRKRRKSKACC